MRPTEELYEDLPVRFNTSYQMLDAKRSLDYLEEVCTWLKAEGKRTRQNKAHRVRPGMVLTLIANIRKELP